MHRPLASARSPLTVLTAGVVLLIVAGCTSSEAEVLTLAELRLLHEEFSRDGFAEFQAIGADVDALASAASIVDDAVYQPTVGVAADDRFTNPEWLDVDGRGATGDEELRALRTEEAYAALRDWVDGQ